MRNDKYVMFRNIMYNELHITKEDIRKWTEESVEKTVEQYLKQINISDYLQNRVDYEIREILFKGNTFNKINEYIAKSLMNQLEIKVKNEI